MVLNVKRQGYKNPACDCVRPKLITIEELQARFAQYADLARRRQKAVNRSTWVWRLADWKSFSIRFPDFDGCSEDALSKAGLSAELDPRCYEASGGSITTNIGAPASKKPASLDALYIDATQNIQRKKRQASYEIAKTTKALVAFRGFCGLDLRGELVHELLRLAHGLAIELLKIEQDEAARRVTKYFLHEGLAKGRISRAQYDVIVQDSVKRDREYYASLIHQATGEQDYFGRSVFRQVLLPTSSAPGQAVLGQTLLPDKNKKVLIRAAYLNFADFSFCKFGEANLRGVELRWADLRWADLSACDVTGVSFQSTDLRGAEFGPTVAQSYDLNYALTSAASMPWFMLNSRYFAMNISHTARTNSFFKKMSRAVRTELGWLDNHLFLIKSAYKPGGLLQQRFSEWGERVNKPVELFESIFWLPDFAFDALDPVDLAREKGLLSI